VSNQQHEESALSPYRILDLTEGGCMIGARMLGDLGADVIKIEPPAGSPSRIAPFYKDIQDPEKSLFWFAYNSNKRGITLDISKVDGQEIFKRLLETADVVMESFEPGYMVKLGLGYDSLSQVRPDLIMTSISLFGQDGPKANYKGSDLTAWASSGFLYLCGEPEFPPVRVSFHQALLFGGAEAAAGTMTALWHRQMTGEGQYVDTSIQECAISPTFQGVATWDLKKYDILRCVMSFRSPGTGVQFGAPILECKDGHVGIIVQGGGNPALPVSNRNLVNWMDEEGMADDWLKAMNWKTDYHILNVTQDLVDRVNEAVAKFCATKTKAELYEGAIKRGILLSPVANFKDIREDPQLKARDFWLSLTHPELGEDIAYPGPFLRLSESPIKYQRRAPLIGEHNSEVYQKEMGFSSDELICLKQAGVI
jgi:crotonobetainyl-CoA:carnitine CoA-transferase CaiB-like acyl-CoA transferase